MKITEIKAVPQEVELREPFTVAFATYTHIPILLVRIMTDTGLVGDGEVNPMELITSESIASELAALPALQAVLVGTDPLAIEAAHRAMAGKLIGHSALKAGIDIALYDLLGKAAGLPVYKLLGGASDHITTDLTISIGSVATMVADVQQAVAAGFTELKVKVGGDFTQDHDAVAAILAAVPASVHVKLDANQAWTAKQAIQFMTSFTQPNLTILEQPLPAAQGGDNALIRANIHQTLMLDEQVHSAADAAKVVAKREADAINIKLMKADGIYGAEAINRVAEAAGIPCMIGCMAESRLGIAAAVHFAAAHANVRWCDLDSVMLLKDTPWLTGGFTGTGPDYHLTAEPGLGVHVAAEVFA
ncbi:mandelate racemase/muconate lactonizing enzyme family protein [Lacticaseibacillus nasuensis]|uniref:Dipeptide epimerase n=1 Tax=Lacticaseibacillus nasuensis JCM 17158 TaxID=1291734 RepID=A0A0R1K0R8_9LACO|nr:dipeptide epimerase [Lacticaseibacillus nasuensis]KRK72967.1 muconate cycloisomerase [Lacticaseibacillus nasuensis JCM 17158]